MAVRLAVIVSASLAGLLGTAGVAAASPTAAPATNGPSIANTTQTQYFRADKSGGYKFSTQVVFATTTFSASEFGDTGTFSVSGSTLKMKVKKSSVGDKGCSFIGTYDPASTYYAGSYTCPGGYRNTFAVSTTGS